MESSNFEVIDMGWYGTPGATKTQVKKEILGDYKPIAHKMVGNELWMVVRGNVDPTKLYIILALLSCNEGCWGYKPMDETMGPYYYGCPTSYFDMVPLSNYNGETLARKSAEDFRNQCRKVQALRNAAFLQVFVTEKPISFGKLGEVDTFVFQYKERGFMIFNTDKGLVRLKPEDLLYYGIKDSWIEIP
jgi:hypothetical protein